MQMQSKMMVYDQAISQLNNSQTSGHIISYRAFTHSSISRVNTDVSEVPHFIVFVHKSFLQPRSLQMTVEFRSLAKITMEPPALPPVEHAGAHILNTSIFERKYSKAYLGNPEVT
jgi:nuclear pore complex protein Nup93